MINLKGKVVIVTGAAQGIGKAIAAEYAKLNATAILTDIDDKVDDAAEQIRKMGVNAEAHICDVTDRRNVDDVAKAVLEKHNSIDVLVNNAGIFPQKNYLELDRDLWDKTMDINLNGIFNWTKAVIPHMVEKNRGKIVNIGSIAGAVVGFQNLVHYSASKGGVLGFTRGLALELAGSNIQVNAIAPGAIKTPGAAGGEEQEKQMRQIIPAGRMGKPEDIAYAAVFLGSDKSNYITGELLVVDGGWTIT